jgi:hypothetical protein
VAAIRSDSFGLPYTFSRPWNTLSKSSNRAMHGTWACISAHDFSSSSFSICPSEYTNSGMSRSSAMARVMALLPVPGGPYSTHPRFHGMPRSRYQSRSFRHISTSRTSFFTGSGKYSLSVARPGDRGELALPSWSGEWASSRYIPSWYHARLVPAENRSSPAWVGSGTRLMKNRLCSVTPFAQYSWFRFSDAAFTRASTSTVQRKNDRLAFVSGFGRAPQYTSCPPSCFSTVTLNQSGNRPTQNRTRWPPKNSNGTCPNRPSRNASCFPPNVFSPRDDRRYVRTRWARTAWAVASSWRWTWVTTSRNAVVANPLMLDQPRSTIPRTVPRTANPARIGATVWTLNSGMGFLVSRSGGVRPATDNTRETGRNCAATPDRRDNPAKGSREVWAT